METVKVNMFGTFSLSVGEKQIDSSDNRSRKVWLLLAYLILHRGRHIPQDELSGLFWDDASELSDSGSALKTMLYRARASLDKLAPGAGHRFIIRREGSYAWNPEVPIVLDLEEFDRLCAAGDAEEEDSRLPLYREALELYAGEVLPRLNTEAWVIPISVAYSEQYLRVATEALRLLEKRDLSESAARLARTALTRDPYREEFATSLMRNLLILGRRQEAAGVYEEFRDRLYALFGVLPCEELRELYRKAGAESNLSTLTMEGLLEQLREAEPQGGALVCDYDFFQVLYRSAARSVIRSGDTIHIALLTLVGRDGADMSRAVLDRAMDNFREIIRVNLRNGDAVTRCGVNQYVVMLQQANYENSCMVCQRISRAFTRQYPHTQAEISFTVRALEPLAQ